MKSAIAVNEIGDRMSAAQIPVRGEESVTCCYAVQTKVWIAEFAGKLFFEGDGSCSLLAHYYVPQQ